MLTTDILLRGIDLQLFATANTNLTTDSDLSTEMKTFYSDYIVDVAEPKLVHSQFGQKHPIPANGGKTIEFRKYDQLPKALTALSEGVTPDGQKLVTSAITATIAQYGGYIELSDMLLLTAIDNNMVQATKLLGGQAGRTLDTITREVLVGGDNVLYSGGATARYQLVGGSSTASNNDYLTVDDIKRAVRALKTQLAEPVDDSYVAVIHPDCTYDLTNDPDWQNVKTYSDPSDMYSGEIGRLYGVRFVETTEAKVIHAAGLTAAARNLTVKTTLSATGKTVEVDEAITAAEATALAGRDILINGTLHEIASVSAGVAGAATITTVANVAVADGTDGKLITPGEAGAEGRDVYVTLVLGANAYGDTEISGGGLQHIVKQLGSSGTADPLNQRATVGWKATKVCKRLVEAYMVRIESASTFQSGSN